MAEPITWRNVTGGGGSEAAIALRGYAAAGQGVQDGIGAFQRVIDSRNKIADTNAATALEAQRQGYLDMLQGARTPEELAGMQGSLDEAFLRLPSAVRAQVRGAQEARLSSIRQNLTAGQQFDAAQTELKEGPERDRIALIYQTKGKEAGDAALLESNIRRRADLGRTGLQDVRANNLEQRAGAAETRAVSAEERAKQNHGLNVQSTQQQIAQGALDLTESKEKASDRGTARTLERAMGTAAAAHQTRMAETQSVANEEAKALGLPLGADGRVDPLSLEEPQLKQLNDRLKARGVGDVELLKGGDTAALSSTLDAARASGKYTPAQLAQARTNAAAGFDTTSPGRIGRDKETKERTTAFKNALAEEEKFQTGVVASGAEREKYMEVAHQTLSQYAKPGSWRYESYMRQAADFVEKGGYKAKDPASGKEKRYLPEASQFANLLRQINTTNTLGIDALSSYGEDVTTPLKAWAQSSDPAQRAATLEKQFKARASEKTESKR